MLQHHHSMLMLPKQNVRDLQVHQVCQLVEIGRQAPL